MHTGTAASTDSQMKLPLPLRSLLDAGPWVNAPPLGAADLRGKVVLVNFWTYSCINSLRALPYVKAWAERYADAGLVVVGVHTPEFGFEKDLANVTAAGEALGLRYAIPLDNDYATWRAFNNEAWPAFFFVDAGGMVRQHVYGEGGYDRSEQMIRQLLAERDGKKLTGGLSEVTGGGVEQEADWRDLRSPETYVGYAKAENFASPGGLRRDVTQAYRAAATLPLSAWSLDGSWTVGGEFATLAGTPGGIAFRFHARDLHLVMGPTSRGQPIRFRVTLEGAPPGSNHGVDVDDDGWGTVKQPRMYQLIRQAGTVATRTMRIEFFDVGVRAYVFTFG